MFFVSGCGCGSERTQDPFQAVQRHAHPYSGNGPRGELTLRRRAAALLAMHRSQLSRFVNIDLTVRAQKRLVVVNQLPMLR